MSSIEKRIAAEISAGIEQVRAAVDLIDGGATVPFIARYRKEVTGGLDDTQLRLLEERLGYLRELEDRRAAVIASIDEQGKMTDSLRADILAADNKARLEDLYLPYKPKRRTKAQIAREAGLSRWHSPCVTILPRCLKIARWRISMRKKAWLTSRPHWTARGPSCSNRFRKTPLSWERCVTGCKPRP